MNIRLLIIVTLAAVVIVAGCSGIHPKAVAQKPAITETSLAADLRTIQTVTPHLGRLDTEFANLPNPVELGRDYFDARETEQIEGLLFRFLAIQTTLWDMVDSYGGLDADFPADEIDTKAHVLSITATLLLASHTAFIVARFAEEPIAIEQLNQAYYRSEIPFGSYDRMRVNVTAPDLLKSVSESKALYLREMADPHSALFSLTKADAEYAHLIAQIPELQDVAESRLQQVARYFPSHSKSEELASEDKAEQHKTLYALRSILFKEVSRLKNPTAHVVVFSDDQKHEIFSLLRPGDLVLTYTAGYMSDVFIPGAFKHGITYIGTPEDRKTLGLSASVLPRDERFSAQALQENLQAPTLHDGTQANMIEAVAEGVIFNDLEHIMDTHINRMLVLRPRLTEAEREVFLVEVYSYLGDGYDFRFDFADASQQVCTEVIYRALNGKGAIDFALTERAGHETLSADDIVNYHLDSETFDFVLLVETDPDSQNNEALVFVGTEGERRVETLMESMK